MGNMGGYGAPPASQEPVFFQDPAVYVSRSRVVLNGVTFPINGITSVRSLKVPKDQWVIVVGILLVLASASCILPAMSSSSDAGCGGIGALEFVTGSVMIAAYIWMMKERYVLVIGTAGTEARALVHLDWRYLNAIVEAINQALASRY